MTGVRLSCVEKRTVVELENEVYIYMKEILTDSKQGRPVLRSRNKEVTRW